MIIDVNISYFFAKYVFNNKVNVLESDAAMVRNDVKFA